MTGEDDGQWPLPSARDQQGRAPRDGAAEGVGASPGAAPDVGGLGEETAKLLVALSQWAQERGPRAHEVDDGEAGGTTARVPEGDDAGDRAGPPEQEQRHAQRGPGADHDHAAAHGALSDQTAPCQWCPVCRVVHAVRQTSPEVREHLVAAAGSLLEAVSGLLATQVPRDAGRGTGRGDGESATRPGARGGPGASGRDGGGPGSVGVEHIDLDGADEDWAEPDGGRHPGE